MKATKLLLASVLLLGVSSLAFAGPGPQYWTQQANHQKDQQVRPTAQTKVCATCGCPDMKKA